MVAATPVRRASAVGWPPVGLVTLQGQWAMPVATRLVDCLWAMCRQEKSAAVAALFAGGGGAARPPALILRMRG